MNKSLSSSVERNV